MAEMSFIVRVQVPDEAKETEPVDSDLFVALGENFPRSEEEFEKLTHAEKIAYSQLNGMLTRFMHSIDNMENSECHYNALNPSKPTLQ